MYKKILVPIDPSHIGEMDNVLDLANHLVSKDGQIILLSVVEEIPAYVASQIPKELLTNARDSATAKLKALADGQKSNTTALVKIGHAASTIKSVQQKHDCDLIIISSHKPTTIDYVLGSTASKVVRRAQCPVFVLR